MKDQETIVLFDGICNLCNGFIQFLLKNDRSAQLKFASLQSDFAESLFVKHPHLRHVDSVIFIEKERVYTKSAAVFSILRYCEKWKWLRFFRFLPESITNAAYVFIAKHRYKIWGQRKECLIPSPELKKRFLS